MTATTAQVSRRRAPVAHRLASGHYFVNCPSGQYRVWDSRQIDGMAAPARPAHPWVAMRSATAPAVGLLGAYRTRRDAIAAALAVPADPQDEMSAALTMMARALARGARPTTVGAAQ